MEAIELYNNAHKLTKVCATQKKAFSYWLAHHSDDVYNTLGFDTETTGVTFGVPSILHLDKTDIKCLNVTAFGISLCVPCKNNLVLVWGRIGTELYSECVKLLESRGPKVAHNAKYDARVCEVNDISLKPQIHCTLTQARIHWNTRTKQDLKSLTPTVCPELYGYEDDLKATMKNIRSSYTRNGYPKDYCNYSFLPDALAGEYAMRDVFVCWMLNLILMPQIRRKHSVVYARERKVAKIVLETEKRGVQFNRIRARKEIRKLTIVRENIRKKLKSYVKKVFNPDSPVQVLAVLIDNLKVPKKLLMKKGKPTTEKKILEVAVKKMKNKKAKRFVDALLNLRSHNKVINTYLKPLYYKASFNNGIIYCNFNPTDTRTGRMSSNGPNLENIPRPKSGFDKDNPVRKCFICRPGFTNFYADYKQMEMWLFAFQAKEEVMLKALRDGEDVHATTAIEMLGKDAFDKNHVVKLEIRQIYKQINFGIIYGMGGQGLADELGISLLKAYDLRKAYLEKFPAIKEFIKRCTKELNDRGYVQDSFGRRYNIDPHKGYKAVNALIQGSCAQIFKIGLIGINANRITFPKPKFNLLLYEHDEFVYEIPNVWERSFKRINTKIAKCMNNIPQLLEHDIRLGVDVSKSTKSWADKEEYLMEKS